MIGRIKEALNFMRNQQFEVPFIAFYRKEYIDELLITDLWQIFQWDEKVKTLWINLVLVTKIFVEVGKNEGRKWYLFAKMTIPLGNCCCTFLFQCVVWKFQWMQLRQRKQNMVRLFEKMQQYQFDQIGLDESTLDASIRALTEEDLNR